MNDSQDKNNSPFKFLVVGLGNPENSHAHNRHNVGFSALDAISKVVVDQGIRFQPVFDGDLLKTTLKDSDSTFELFLFKPTTYMNNSGGPVAMLSRFYKISPENTYVVHDDIDLKLGKIKVKCGGGHGGHNGLKSVDSYISSRYSRIRIGVGRPEHKSQVASYVLSNFTNDEEIIMQHTYTKISVHLVLLLRREWPRFIEACSLI